MTQPVFNQESRNFRAQTEEFSFTLLDNGRWICETAAGNGYLVTANGCTCPDHEYRCSKSSGFCKHRVALAQHLFVNEGRDLHREALALRQAEQQAAIAARQAEEDAAFARIFA